MNGWEWRQVDKFGEDHFLTWKNHTLTPDTKDTYIRVVFVDETYLCQFLCITITHMRRMMGEALTYFNITPDDITFTLPSTDVICYNEQVSYALSIECKRSVLYRWEALEAVLGVPGLVAQRHRVKLSGVMKELFRRQTGDSYEFRYETREEKHARSQREYDEGQREVARFVKHMNKLSPDFEEGLRTVTEVARRKIHDIMALYKIRKQEELATKEDQRLLQV